MSSSFALARNPSESVRASADVRLSVEQVSYAHSATLRKAPLFTLEATSFQAKPGEIVAILGPNASGKSTLLKLISGALAPLSGRILLNGIRHPVVYSAHPRAGHRGRPAGEHFALSARAWEFVLQGRHAHGRSLRFESDDDILIAEKRSRPGRRRRTERPLD